MTTKTCKECDQKFVLMHSAQEYCTDKCSKKARTKYVRNKVQMHRIHKNKWVFLHNENTEAATDRIKVTLLSSPAIFDTLTALDKTHNIIGIQITEGNPDKIGLGIAESSSKEE